MPTCVCVKVFCILCVSVSVGSEFVVCECHRRRRQQDRIGKLKKRNEQNKSAEKKNVNAVHFRSLRWLQCVCVWA